LHREPSPSWQIGEEAEENQQGERAVSVGGNNGSRKTEEEAEALGASGSMYKERKGNWGITFLEKHHLRQWRE